MRRRQPADRGRAAIRPAEPGRNALLDAGRAVLADKGVAGLTINAVVARAGMAKGSFYTHFADRNSFISELCTTFHEQLVEVFLEAVAGAPPGAARFRTGMEAYLDACHRIEHAVVLLGEARFAQGLEVVVRGRMTDMGRLLMEDLSMTGWPDPRAVRPLLIAAAIEIVQAEHHAGGRRPDLRDTLFAFVTGPPGVAGSAGLGGDRPAAPSPVE